MQVTLRHGISLINRDTVVTAAHCTTSSVASSYTVYLGVQSKSDLTASGVVRSNVKTVISVWFILFLLFVILF